MNQLNTLYMELHNKGVVSNKKEFAEWLGIKPGNLHLYMNDEIRLSINDKNYKKIAEAGISINWLLTGEGEMFQREKEILPESVPQKIPLLRQTVSCGPGQDWETGDNVEAYIEPLGLLTEGKKLYAFRSRLQDDIYVFGYNGEAFCKLLRFDSLAQKIHIYSVPNKDMDKAELVKTLDSSAEGFSIFGRVLCWIHENRLTWRRQPIL